MRFACVACLLAACAAVDPHTSPVTIAVAPPTAASAPPRANDDEPQNEGWNGPRDANALLGAAGEAITGSPESLVFVHSSAIRADARRDQLRNALLGVLPGWSEFMPYDVVDPIRDVDWVVMSGSLVMGSTESNIILARYNLTEERADVAMATLLKVLPSAHPTSVPSGAPAITARVDGVERLYVRPRPGLLAIVPIDDGPRVTILLARTGAPTDMRRGELLRIADRKPRGEAFGAPQLRGTRVWVMATRKRTTTVRVEGDCDTADAARGALEAIDARLHDGTIPTWTKLVAPWLGRIRLHADGPVVRASVALGEDDVEMLAKLAACRGSETCR
jgi:hypothetical protein